MACFDFARSCVAFESSEIRSLSKMEGFNYGRHEFWTCRAVLWGISVSFTSVKKTNVFRLAENKHNRGLFIKLCPQVSKQEVAVRFTYVSHVPSYVSHIPSYVSHVPSYISHIPSYISHVPSYVSHITSVTFLHTSVTFLHTSVTFLHTSVTFLHTSVTFLHSTLLRIAHTVLVVCGKTERHSDCRKETMHGRGSELTAFARSLPPPRPPSPTPQPAFI